MAVMGPIPPPPGVTPNFDNPEQGGRHVVILGLVGIPIAFLFLALRLYTKSRINRSFGSEDGIYSDLKFIFRLLVRTWAKTSQQYASCSHGYDDSVAKCQADD